MAFALALPWSQQPFVDAAGRLTPQGRASLEEVLRRLVEQIDGLAALETLTESDIANLATLQAEVDAAEATLAAHVADTANPHSVTAAQVGADPTGTAAAAVAAHVALADPHTQYLTAAEGNAAYQPLDGDLTAIAALTPSNDDILQRKAGAWTNRSMAQLSTDLGLATAYQPLDATLTALAGANWAANALPIGSGADTVAQVAFAANTFPARASAGNLVANAISDNALTFLASAGAAVAGLVNAQAYRVTDASFAFTQHPAFVSAASTASNIPTADNYAGLHMPLDSTAASQFFVRANANTPRAFIRGASGSAWGSYFELAYRGGRVSTATTSGSISPNIGTNDEFERSAQSAALTINAPSGTPTDGQRIRFRIKDNGTSRALTWNATYEGTFVALPAATTVNKWHLVEFEYNATASLWQCIRAAVQL
jgi:hypothetical protein